MKNSKNKKSNAEDENGEKIKHEIKEISKINIIFDNKEELKECINSHPILSIKFCKSTDKYLIAVTNTD